MQFEVGGRILPAESLARYGNGTTASPASTLMPATRSRVKETFFVPVQEPGA